jgi:hypothetical protein
MSIESYSFYFSLMRLGQGSEVEADLSVYEIAAEKSKEISQLTLSSLWLCQ